MFTLIHTAHAAEGISVKLSPYIVGHIGTVPITATLITTWCAMGLLILGAFLLRGNLARIPGTFQGLVEMTVGGVYQYVEDTLENKKLAQRYFPILMTMFLFLLVMNWTGLLPGVTSIGFYDHEGTSEVAKVVTNESAEVKKHFTPLLYPPATDLNIAIAFALIAMCVIECAGIMALGVFKYGGKFIDISSPLNFIVGIIELISEIGRLISFSFRLFGNIFAGKTLLTVAIFFIPFIVPVPILAYEAFVGFIQAGVFSFLTLIFIKLAVAEPHH
jgi:F-type H+-transporting ATPase subunit a